MKTQKLREEDATLCVPAGADVDPFHKSAFYNPRMKFNRSASSLALGAALSVMQEESVLDGLAGTGARGVRYAVENKPVRVTFVEANADALPLLKKNIVENKLSKRARVEAKYFHEFVGECREYYDFVELDPFGTPAFFLEGASMVVRKKGVLSATATDLAKLCGKEPETCIRNYSSKPLRVSICHELALRILLKRIAEAFALRDMGIEPLFCFYQGHAIKAVVKCEKSSAKATQSMRSFAYANYCYSCLSRWLSEFPEKCECGGKTDYAGPLWKNELCDAGFLKKTIQLNEERNYSQKQELAKMLEAMLKENSLPSLFYDVHELSRNLRKPSPKSSELLEKLRAHGFSASQTHFSPTGIRTDASAKEIKKLF